MNKEVIKKHWEGIITELGFSLFDENFKDTPNRIARMYEDIFDGISCKDKINKILSKSFPTKYKGMVVEKGIKCFSYCPHHFVTIRYNIDIAYVPGETGLGLSKLPRLVTLLAKAPKLQEDFTEEIVDILEKTLKTNGVVCVVKGEHMCMQSRGCNQKDCVTITSSVRGLFDENKNGIKDEFMSLINLK